MHSKALRIPVRIADTIPAELMTGAIVRLATDITAKHLTVDVLF
jgi:hypothetical protein